MADRRGPFIGWRRFVAMAAVCAVGTAMPLAAQDAGSEAKIGTRFKKERFEGDRYVRQTLNHYGHCIAGFKSDNIEAFLLEPSDDNWESMTSTPNNRTRCALHDMSSGFADIRGALSEGWYIKRFKAGPPAAFSQGEQLPPPEDEVVARIAAADSDGLASVILAEFARCVAATAPIQIDALLRTKVETDEERAAVSAIGPYMGPCAFEGQDLAFDYTGIRSMLAHALADRAARLPNGAN